jgi:hypothetical protein
VDEVDKSVILIAANIHKGLDEIIDFCEFAKNAPKGTSNPQAGRSSRPGCAIQNKTSLQSDDLSCA